MFSLQAGGEEGGREVVFVYFLLASFPPWPVGPENKQWEPASMNGEPAFLKWLLFPAAATVFLLMTAGRERKREH